MIPHKSKKYRAILDLSFVLKVAGWDLPSVNEKKKETSPAELLDHVRTVMPHIIKALLTASLSEDTIHFSILDIKDELWIMVCAVVEEWNLAYVLKNHPESSTKLVILSDLQMRWTLSPCFLYVASETSRDIAESYAYESVVTILKHPLE